MARYKCMVCDYVYDENVGDVDHDVYPVTTWEQLPADWVCPTCGFDKSAFKKI